MIRNIVFDLGRVLFDFDHAISFTEYERLGAKFDTRSFFKEFYIDEYERGGICGDEFIERMQRNFPSAVDRRIIAECWQDIFTPIDEMLALIPLIRERHRTFVLSNTCDLHWDFIEDRWKLSSLVDGSVTSFEARARKPELEIYRFAERKLGLNAAETVFIDDIAENAQGAVAAGWAGIHHISPARTMHELRALDIFW